MKYGGRYIVLWCVTLFCIISQSVYGATFSVDQADILVKHIEGKLSTFTPQRAEKMRSLIHTKLLGLQNSLSKKNHTSSHEKNMFYEKVRRGLFRDSFDTPHAIFDDGVGAIWTHAPKGFGILYNPINTPTIGAFSSGTRNTLINGSYFSRREDSKYHAGFLWSRGVLWSEMVFDDPQLTHTVCLDKNNHLTFWSNDVYFDGLMDACVIAFQAGPMIYSLIDDRVEENFFPKSYIGRAHNRTVMVVFEENGRQDLWFLTVINPVTLSQVRDIVLRESRFQGEYNTLRIFNLDGGSSVAHRNPDHPQLNFGSSKALPVVFEIYK